MDWTGPDRTEPNRTGLDRTETDWTGLDWTGPDRTGPDWTGLEWTGPDWTGPDRTGLDWTEPDWTGLDWTGPNRTGLDWTGLNRTGLDWTGMDDALHSPDPKEALGSAPASKSSLTVRATLLLSLRSLNSWNQSTTPSPFAASRRLERCGSEVSTAMPHHPRGVERG
eukprot:488119-Prorocentrum_minimum.AAC.1